MESCHLAAARRVKLWSLNSNLFSPIDWIPLIGPLKPYLAENISLQSSNCNFWDLQTLWSSSLTKPDLLRFGCSSGHVLSKTKSVTHFVFTFLTSLTRHLSMVKFSNKKNQCYKIFLQTSLTIHGTISNDHRLFNIDRRVRYCYM